VTAEPQALKPLEDLVHNLRWSWDPKTTALFERLAPEAWAAGHNPIAVLEAVKADPSLAAPHGDAIKETARDLSTYLASASQVDVPGPVAYFSAEFAITECLPIYSGGLGVLAGDHLKAASDLGLNLRAVGLMYRYGYFRQQIDESGWQREHYDRQDPTKLPVSAVLAESGEQLKVPVPFPERTVWAAVWVAQVGRVPLYLLDTDLPENREDDRWITGHLYGGDQDTRIRQELVLGVGGVRLLRALPGEQPKVFHMNEGHSAFAALELAHEELAQGAPSFAAALDRVAPKLIFTTHTPVAAGHDAFAVDLMSAYFSGYRENALKLTEEELMSVGRRSEGDDHEGFSMTVLALRAATRRNAVSQLHGVVSKEMWGDVGVGLGNGAPVADMDAVTNGVHTGTWIGPEMGALLDETVGDGWRRAARKATSWERFTEASSAAVWQARTTQRARLLEHVRRVAGITGGELAGPADPERTLVVGFARRFATYKRAALLLEEPEKLAAVLRDPARPVVLVFAGKAHPRDEPGKGLMQRIVQASRDERFRGHLIFLEGYDVELARNLVQGSDVWLNTPRRPLEASGTSGMKAALNGAQHLSELDGWWDEAYRPDLGWALGQGISGELAPEEVDVLEAAQLMRLMEEQVVPLFFDRDESGLPQGWVNRVKATVATLGPQFSADRQVAEYAERLYGPAARADMVGSAR
jgi:starch phosphorylase